MYSRAEYYRRRGIEAQERADRAVKAEIKLAFLDVANGWFALAEQTARLDRQYDAPVQRQTEPSDFKRG